MPAGDPVIGFETTGLRSGGTLAGTAGESAGQAVSLLVGTQINASAFGDVATAARFGAELGAVRDGFSRVGEQVHAYHQDLDGRSQDTAGQGDQLVGTTTTMAARLAAPGPISAAMSGE